MNDDKTSRLTGVVDLHLASDDARLRRWLELGCQLWEAAAKLLQPDDARLCVANELAHQLETVYRNQHCCCDGELSAHLIDQVFSEVDWLGIADRLVDQARQDQRSHAPMAITSSLHNQVFPLGSVAMTSRVSEEIPLEELLTAFDRHSRGDWGDCGEIEQLRNEGALRDGGTLQSVYHTCRGQKFHVITDQECSLTTVLLNCEILTGVIRHDPHEFRRLGRHSSTIDE